MALLVGLRLVTARAPRSRAVDGSGKVRGGKIHLHGRCGGYFNEHWQYKALNQLAEIDTSAQSGGFPVSSPNPSTANVFFTRYHFSATQNNGQVMSVDDARQSGANIVYTYDALKRLTKATTTSWTQNIGYDGFGNITSKDVPTGSAEPAFPGAVSSKNWLTGVSYDLNGNALGVNAFALTYDAENRLATATSGSAVESYSYDESNHRLEKTFGTSDYLYFYGPGGKFLSIRAVSTTGLTSMVADRVYFGGLLLGSAGTVGSQDVPTLTDRLGTAATGYPYGTNRGNAAGNDQPDFATYTKDGTTGFEYANQRYYSAGLGRFLTADPYMESANISVPSAWNRYTYSFDDPLDLIDPTGVGPSGPCTPEDLSGCGGTWEVSVSGDDGDGGQQTFPGADPGETRTCNASSYDKKGGIIDCDSYHVADRADRFSTLSGKFNLGTVKVSDAAGAKTALKLQLADLSANCKKVLPQDLAANTKAITFLDARTSPDWTAAVGSSNAMDLLIDPTNPSAGISSNVLLGSRFFNSGPGRQGITLLHEVLHYDTQMNDKQFDVNYGVPIRSGDTYSSALSNWLSNDCH